MTEISSVGTEADLSVYEMEEMFSTKEIPASEPIEPAPNEDSSQMGSTLEMMVHQEALYRATSPHIAKIDEVEKIKAKLNAESDVSKRFFLQLELFKILFQNFKDSGGTSEELTSTFNKFFAIQEEEAREEFISTLSPSLRELFDRYLEVVLAAETANKRAVQSMVFSSVPYQPYYLEILRMEQDLDCEIIGDGWINKQIIELIEGLRAALKNRVSGFAELHAKALEFYWEAVVPIYHQSLVLYDQRGSFENFATENVPEGHFYFVFGEEVTKLFEPRSEYDSLEALYPLVVKYGEIEFLKARFDQKFDENVAAWDKAFAWVSLHIEMAAVVKDTDPQKSQRLLSEAKTLTRDTLAPSYFSWNYDAWKAKEEEALRLISEAEKSLGFISGV